MTSAGWDPGVQPERTAFGWERTAIAALGAGLVLARTAARSERWTLAAIGVACTAAAGLLLVWASRHYSGIRANIAAERAVIHPRLIKATAAGVAILAAGGIGLAVAVITG